MTLAIWGSVCKLKIEFAVYVAPNEVDIGIQCLFKATCSVQGIGTMATMEKSNMFN